MESRQKASRPTERQRLFLVEFMKKNLKFVRNQIFEQSVLVRMWDDLTVTLNSLGEVNKSKRQWQRHWSDWKASVKSKCIRLQASSQNCDPLGPSNESFLNHLTKLEKKVYNIIGSNFDADDVMVDIELDSQNTLKKEPPDEDEELNISENEILNAISMFQTSPVDDADSPSAKISRPTTSIATRIGKRRIRRKCSIRTLTSKRKRILAANEISWEDKSTDNIKEESAVVFKRLAAAVERLANSAERQANANERQADAAERLADAAERQAVAAERQAEIAERQAAVLKSS